MGTWIGSKALELLFGRAGQIALAVLGLFGLIGWYNHHQQSIGATKERAKIEVKAHENVKKAENVRRASERGDGGGVRDPYAAAGR
ncbi:hypothetical protein JDN40_14280 [Rhodomicrobium vannielii ATCC 17100]|uniref:hypothetical protein n=1 Tax=Rhodomicrobium vannielii TaxID=1069 RepID=UPI0019194CA4|nr:hypothetical protein [Rhodomicrobium vannielii]MBJ7535275.1 hypothetical protein [Rhodomicrobium vannielii ATCC 17100]